jgi:Ca2+-binding EF-hand superfamily protein
MMVSGVTSGGGFSAAGLLGGQRPDPAKMQERFFANVDANGDGGIDKAELTTAIEKIREKTGSTESVDVDNLFSTLDSGSDGSISQAELSEHASALFETLRGQMGGPPFGGRMGPPPMREAPSADDILGELDTDGDASISRDELTTALSAYYEKARASYVSIASSVETSHATLTATA